MCCVVRWRTGRRSTWLLESKYLPEIATAVNGGSKRPGRGLSETKVRVSAQNSLDWTANSRLFTGSFHIPACTSTAFPSGLPLGP